MQNKNKSLVDQLIIEVEYAIGTIYDNKSDGWSANDTETKLNKTQSSQSEKIMRINHMGEVCAQALYRGQAAFTKDKKVKQQLYQMCKEENYHLKLCNQRLEELDGKKSMLNPLWYLASFTLGSIAGLKEKDWKLGFIEETEKQVKAHLEGSISSLPKQDKRSKDFLNTIAKDEEKHRNTAQQIGANEIPEFLKKTMSILSTIMKKITGRI
mgnify:FL=1